MSQSSTRPVGKRLRPGGFLWANRRAALGISIRDLERASGVGRAVLSYAENGRLMPTAEEFDRIMEVLYPESRVSAQ